MSQRNRAAVRVDARIVVFQAELMEAGETLRRERFVDLDHRHVIERKFGALQNLLRGRDRAHAHEPWLDADHR